MAFVFLLSGCAPEASPTAPESSFIPVRPPSDPASEAWGSAGKTEVARVGSVGVMVEDVRAIMAAGLADEPARALEMAVENEALAQWAAKSESMTGSVGSAPIRFRQALVQRLLRYEFEEKLTPDTVPFDYIKSAFWAPSIRKRYIHFDAFHVKDIQYLCCLSVSECNYEPESRESCFEEGAKAAQMLFEQAQAANPTSVQAFVGFANEKMRQVHAGFTLHDFAVFYDIEASYDENTRVDRATRPVMEALLTMKEGALHKPVRDMFGWHIMFLANHEPEKQLKPEEPSVRKEIAEGIYPKVQEQELMKFLGQQLGKRQVEIRAPQIRALATHGRAQEGGTGE